MPSPAECLARILDEGRYCASRTLGEAGAAELHAHAMDRFVAIEPTIPPFRSSMTRELFAYGPPVLALYQALQRDLGVDREPALGLVEEMLLAFHRKERTRRPLLNAAMRAAFRLKPARSLLLRSLSTEEPDGFRFETVSVPGALMAFDVRECALVRFARRHGAPEIVPMICRLDDLVARELHGIELRRTGTIGTGAERCDFRYVDGRK